VGAEEATVLAGRDHIYFVPFGDETVTIELRAHDQANYPKGARLGQLLPPVVRMRLASDPGVAIASGEGGPPGDRV
jgi:hypothetical protein